MELTREQSEGLRIAVQRYNAHEPYTVIAGYAGSGKAQPIDTIIPTPNGMRKLGELKVGDYVFDKDGKPTQILGVYPQGKKQCYKITFSNNQSTLCAGDHLWSYYLKNNSLGVRSTLEMLQSGIKNSSGYKYKIPQAKAVEYSHKNFDIDPYVIGAFLGDGCCLQRYLTLSSETDEIPKEIGRILGATPERAKGGNYNWTFRWKNYKKEVSWVANKGAHRFVLREKLKTEDYFNKFSECLMVKSYDKSIPEEYEYGDIDQRLSLVQGLLDTDGTIGNKDDGRYNVRFTSASLKLVTGLQRVLNSLGYSSTIILDKREIKYTNKQCYALSINISNQEKYKLFRLKKKKDIALAATTRDKRKDYTKKSIISIEPLNEYKEMVCIYVDNDDHLYLTNDYIVTHNTTLIKYIIHMLDIPEDEVAYIAYTGKASLVMREKGCSGAMTAHRLLYQVKQREDGTYYFVPKRYIGDYKIIVLDECSMLPNDMWELLLTHNIHVLALGDPGQLPPVSGNSHILDKPHIFLSEIVRQALDSPIIRLSMDVREGKYIPYNYKGVCRVVQREDIGPELLLGADQIICGKNITRHKLNEYMRKLIFGERYTEEPQSGDKVICLKNHWNIVSDNEEPLINGMIGNIDYVEFETGNKNPLYHPVMHANFFLDDDNYYDYLQMDYKLFVDKEPTINKDNWKAFPEVPRALEFDYGYAITCHKSQGSQFEKVVIFDEWLGDKEYHNKWLYTACTRPSSRLVIVK